MRRKLINDPIRLAEINALAGLMSRAASNAERDRILENRAKHKKGVRHRFKEEES
jgi:hypothetical protein